MTSAFLKKIRIKAKGEPKEKQRNGYNKEQKLMKKQIRGKINKTKGEVFFQKANKGSKPLAN